MSDALLFRQLFELESSTYTYILADRKTKEAAIIDAVLETSERDIHLIKELGLQLKYILETHVHADHITGAARLKALFPEAQTVLSHQAKVTCANILVRDGDSLHLGNTDINVLETPGHTNTCLSYYTNGMVFTGDALLIRGCGRTDFQQGNAPQLYDSVHNKIFNLPDETLLYPAHDYKGMSSSTIGEEKRCNPRLKLGITQKEFVEIMKNLNLAYPKKMDVAVPGNLVCGQV